MEVITEQKITESGCLNVQKAQKLIEKTFFQKALGTAYHAQEIAMKVGTSGFFYSLPACLTEEGIAGLKWTAHMPVLIPEQVHTSPVVILNDLHTGSPLAVMEGQQISGFRTGAVTATALKYLADSKTESLLICGSGFQAEHQLQAAVPFLPHLKEIHIWSRHQDHAEKMIHKYRSLLATKNIQPVVHSVLPSRLDFASIIIGATSTETAYLQASHFTEGQLYVHIGKKDLDPIAVSSFDTIVCDDFEAGLKSSSQSLFQFARKDNSIVEQVTLLQEVMTGKKQVKQSQDHKLMFNAFGLPIFDLALAHAVYEVLPTI